MRIPGATLRVCLATILALLGAISHAWGQSANSDLDVRADRPGAAPATGSHSATSGFELIVTAPISYTNFAVQTATEEVISRKGDVHFWPDVALKWSHQFDWFKLTVGADLLMDRYFTERSANEDTISGSFRVAFTDGRSDLFVPYVSYTSWVDFLPMLSRRDDTLQDFAAGFTSSIGFNGSDGILPYRKANDTGDTYVRFDARAGERVSDPRDFQNRFIAASVLVGYIVNRELEVSVAPMLKAKWYDDYFGDVRRDFNASALIQLTWTPSWLKAVARGAEIDFSATIERNISNLPEKIYTRWDAGPALALRMKF